MIFNVPAGNQVIEITAEDVEAVVPAVETALEKQQKEVEVNGCTYPVSEEPLQALTRLAKNINKHQLSTEDKASIEEKRKSLEVPILEDNIEEEGFTACHKQVRGRKGGLPGVLKTQPVLRKN